MKAAEVMTANVVTAHPQTTVKEIAELMVKHRIGGVPVVDPAGNLVGILSETDLLHRAETGTEKRRKWWLGAFVDSDRLAREYAASHAHKASDIMTTSVITVDADTDLGAVADLLERKNLKRVPVTSGGKLVGMITRGDLVRAFVARAAAAESAAGAGQDVLAAVRERMRREAWLDSSLVNVRVDGGVVELAGLAASADQRRALRLLVEDTPGVSRVDDKLGIKPPSMGV